MVVDSSALVAILLGEPEGDALALALAGAEMPVICAPNWLEAASIIVPAAPATPPPASDRAAWVVEVVGATDVIVVYGGERRELAVAQAMSAMVMQGQLAVAAFHPGAAALEAIGAFAGHLFQARDLGGW
ncbi:MAG: hypothetical protein CAPSK01_004130 [Candidatus Accumulibacter vicinus]|uniref:PIN domain-containing protein n=1 Tax=Candidatus Accumulibacter vicinus TaxID=2954382 RepID=A0A084XVW5_9PROT|nr:MAG: hypothetical protein CAPSK01_004130 [Candidatus Accumulibacter vicinus]